LKTRCGERRTANGERFPQEIAPASLSPIFSWSSPLENSGNRRVKVAENLAHIAMCKTCGKGAENLRNRM
jgi:hypothetical protein